MEDYIYLIGSIDDFSSSEELLKSYLQGTINRHNASVFKYTLPNIDAEAAAAMSFDPYDIACLVGRGMAFENDWCEADTVSYFSKASDLAKESR